MVGAGLAGAGVGGLAGAGAGGLARGASGVPVVPREDLQTRIRLHDAPHVCPPAHEGRPSDERRAVRTRESKVH